MRNYKSSFGLLSLFSHFKVCSTLWGIDSVAVRPFLGNALKCRKKRRLFDLTLCDSKVSCSLWLQFLQGQGSFKESIIFCLQHKIIFYSFSILQTGE